MKKMLFVLLAVTFSSSAYAGCGEGPATHYKVTNGKVAKVKGTTVECANIYGGFKGYQFELDDRADYLQIGVELDGEIEKSYEIINDKNAKIVKRPNGVPSKFTCYQQVSEKGSIYCVNEGY